MNSSFIQRNRKKTQYKYNNTIDKIHNEKIQEYQDSKNNLNKLKQQLEKLEKKKWKSNTELNDEELEEKLENTDKIKILIDKIYKIQNNTSPNKYLLDTSSLLFDYYDTHKNTNTITCSVIDLFNRDNASNTTNITTKPKNNIINQYFEIIADNGSDGQFYKNTELDTNVNIYRCKTCNTERIYEENEGIILCTQCGTEERILIDNDKPSYKDPPREISYFAYKKINHFNEWLAQFQAKESTDIPPDVYDLIKTELKKENINIKNVKQKKIRDTLKKLNLNKYYEHVPHILNRLTGKPAPKISREIEEKLRIMFKDIQQPWIQHCPQYRSNFFSYSYILYKFLELLEKDELLDYFTLLKSREKLAEQDKIWKFICNDLDWEFIKTI
jgi:DNA-directed RNA polymerase subunit RPC12/RpoP